MKGLTFTVALMFFALSLLVFSSLYQLGLLEFNRLTNKNSLMDRIYYKYDSLENSLRNILNEELGFDKLNVSFSEGNFNVVNFTEQLPLDPSVYKTDIDRYKIFAETKLTEPNIFVSLNISEIRDNLPLTILPYNIDYLHINGLGQRQVEVDPKTSWNSIKSYYVKITLLEQGNLTEPGEWSGAGCTGNDFRLDVTVIGNTSTFRDARNIDSARMCKLPVDDIDCPAGLGFVKVTQNANSREEDRGVLQIDVQQNCNITAEISLNLTDMPGKLGVGLPAQSIKVKEMLYEIEKNDTIYIYK